MQPPVNAESRVDRHVTSKTPDKKVNALLPSRIATIVALISLGASTVASIAACDESSSSSNGCYVNCVLPAHDAGADADTSDYPVPDSPEHLLFPCEQEDALKDAGYICQ